MTQPQTSKSSAKQPAYAHKTISPTSDAHFFNISFDCSYNLMPLNANAHNSIFPALRP
jgi:hypothetical protein